jgi:hypothetical protein
MPYYDFFWTPETETHIEEHGVSREDFENAVCDPITTDYSRSTGDPACKGLALDGRLRFYV